jgi:hypothetical protein
MNELIHKHKYSSSYKIFLSLFLALGMVTGLAATGSDRALASNETATVGFEMTPRGQMFKEVQRPVDWALDTLIQTEDANIYPLRQATLTLPTTMSFNPDPAMPVCPDSQIGPPPTNVSVPIPTAVGRCPNSVIGNGSAIFQLAGLNSPDFKRDGYIVIFNGGRVSSGTFAGRPRLKIWAYSYGTGAGIYTEGILRSTGLMLLDIPRLTADSAVTSINLRIPGQEFPVTDPAAPEGTTVPGGESPGYAKARCPGDSWTLNGSFLLGNRNNAGEPVPPETTVADSDDSSCVGLAGSPRIGAIGVSGPNKVKRNRAVRYRIVIRNTGTATMRNTRLRVFGRGVSLTRQVGSLAPNTVRRFNIRPRFRQLGRIRTTFRAVTGNAGTRQVVRIIRVVR